MSRIARLEELLIADNADKIPIVDISDLSLSEDGKEKYITVGNLGVGGDGGDLPVHNIIGDKHNGAGNPFDLVGFVDTNTLGLITPSSDPGVFEKVLKTDTDGEIDIEGITTKIVRSDEELFINSPSLVSVNANNIELTAILGTTVNSLLSILGNIDVTGKIDVTETIIADDFIKSLVSMNAPVYTSDGDLLINAGDDVKIDSTSNLIKILAENSLQSDHFVSQLTGWRMTYDGELDTRYMYSDQLKVKLFITDLEQALAGSSILTKSSTTLSRPFVVPFPGEYNLLYVDDLPSAEGMAAAESGDMVRLRKYNRTGGSLEYTDVWGVVTEYTDQADKEQRWKFTRVAGGATVSTPAMVGSIQTYAAPFSTSAVLTKPTGTLEGHTLYAFFVLDSATVGVTAPDVDWTLLASDSITGLSVFLFSKVAGASEGADYTFNFDESVTVNSSVQTWSGIDESQQISITKEETATTTFTTGSLNILGVNETQFLFSGFNASLPATEPTYWVESLDTGFGSIRQYCAWTNGFDIGEHGFAEGTISGSATSVTISLNATPTYSGLDLETGYAEPYSVIAAETFAIDYGVSGNGYIEMTTIDGAYGSNSPYMRVVTWTGHPVTGATVRTMNGNLKGIFGVSDEFGLFAGEGTTDDDSYLRASNVGMLLNNIPIKLYSSGVQKVNIDPNGVDVWFSGNGGVDKRFYWNGSILTISGGINITSPSTFGGSGFLQIGSGTVDVDLAGWYFDNTRIVGQAGTPDDQVLLDLNGRILAGAGNVIVNRDGIQIKADTTTDYEFQNEQNAVTFLDSTGVETVARIIGIPGGLQIYSLQPDTSTSVASFGAILDGLIFAPSSPGFPRIIATIDASDGFLELLASSAIKLYANSSIVPDITIEQGVGVSFTQSISMPTNTAITFGGYGYGPKAGIAIGDITHDYTPTTGNWTTNGSTLLLSALNYTTIGFHDSANRVDFIRVGAGLITIGYDGGFGSANALFPGLVGIGASATRSLTVDGTIKSAGADATFTTSGWGKALELDEGMAIQWLRNASSYSRGIGYTSDGNLYFFKSTANDNSAAPLYDLILYSSGWIQVTGINPTDGIGTSWAALTLNTGWVNYGSPYDNAGYKKVGDLVFLEGFVVRTSGTETIIATLPVGYRPAAQKCYTVATSTGYGVVVITTAGQIVHISGGVGLVQLDGLSFGTT